MQSVKYKIEATQYVKRTKWFINDYIGIGIVFWWNGSKADVIIDMSYVEDGYHEEVEDLVKPSYKIIHDEITVDIDYPFPQYFTDPDRGIVWSPPKMEKKISENSTFAVTMHSNYIGDKAFELEQNKQKNAWGTIGDEFKWDRSGIQPAEKQSSVEYQNLADIWRSESWVSDKRLNEFMLERFDMQLDEDYFSFYKPNVSKL